MLTRHDRSARSLLLLSPLLLLLAWPAPAAARGLLSFDPRLPAPAAAAPDPGLAGASPLAAPDTRAEAATTRSGPRLKWRWARFRTWQYIVTLTLAPGTFIFARWLPQPGRHWTKSNVIDQDVRGALRAVSVDGRYNANLLSDIFWYSMMAYPVLIDTALVAWGIHRSPEVAWQMFFITGQAFAITGTVGNLLAFLGRSRPFTQNCDAADAKCDTAGANRSFYSGHTAVSVTSACLLCFFHLKLDLYGGGLADALTCATGAGMAATVGVLRIAADKHYFTDVIFGVGVGLVSGLVLPWYLHFRYERASEEEKRTGLRTVGPLVTDTGAVGLSYIGAF